MEEEHSLACKAAKYKMKLQMLMKDLKNEKHRFFIKFRKHYNHRSEA